MNINDNNINRFVNKINLIYKDKTNQILDYEQCWEWNAGFYTDYPCFWFDGKTWTAHRFSYLLYYKKDPNDLFVCHKCDNTKCVNPHHLFLGTAQDNATDMKNKNRQLKGEECHTSVLTEQDVKQILTDIWENKYNNIYEINAKYKTSKNTIRELLDGKTWKYIIDQLKVPLSEIKNKVIRDMSKGNASKLTENQVKEIKFKLRQGHNQLFLACEYNVQQGTISNIKNNKSWKHVKI